MPLRRTIESPGWAELMALMSSDWLRTRTSAAMPRAAELRVTAMAAAGNSTDRIAGTPLVLLGVVDCLQCGVGVERLAMTVNEAVVGSQRRVFAERLGVHAGRHVV